MNLEIFTATYISQLEKALTETISSLDAPNTIKEAMHYSLSAGGKRIRPLLLFATLQALGEDPNKGLLTAAALEMVHTYSLIHDDLPSMDNDDLRRGKPTNHKVFGEAMAILAGDALLTYSFQIISEMDPSIINSDKKMKLISEFARAAGTEGMVGGQVADLEGEGKHLTLQELEYIHIHKTGKLLQYSVRAGAIIANANEKMIRDLTAFAYHLGLAFQIRDDILDIEGNEEILGKPLGSDLSKEKSTYPSLLTMDGAKKALEKHMKKAREILKEMNVEGGLFEEIINLIATRNH